MYPNGTTKNLSYIFGGKEPAGLGIDNNGAWHIGFSFRFILYVIVLKWPIKIVFIGSIYPYLKAAQKKGTAIKKP